MKSLKFVRLIISYYHLASGIVLASLIMSPTLARGVEDKIVFVSKRNGTPEVFLVKGLDGRPIQLTRNRFASWPSISPDGTEVVFVSSTPNGISNIFKLHIATNRIEKLMDDAASDTEYKYLDWSPDGRQLLFLKIMIARQGEKTMLCVMDMKTRDLRQILQSDSPTFIYHPSWSPDSQQILFRKDLETGLYGLFITDDNGIHVKNVGPNPFLATIPTWSPSRSKVAYLGLVVTKPPPPNPFQIYAMNLNDEIITALTAGGAQYKFPLAWSPDGQKILFIISSPYDEEVRRSDIFVMDPDGENKKNLTQSAEREGTASWSPDGKQIVFTRRLSEEELSIFLMDSNGQNQQRLTFKPGFNGSPHWSPDGDKIAFLSNRDGSRRIYTMDTNGHDVRQITHGQRIFVGSPAWSPDGKWLAFGSGNRRGWGIYLIDPHGHNETQIFHSNVSGLHASAGHPPAWSPNSQHLVFVAPWLEAWREGWAGLVRIRADGGIPTYLKTEELIDWRDPVWSPDGDSLLFSAREKRGPNVLEQESAIFLMNLDTSESRHFILSGIKQLIVKSDFQLLRLVWAPDASQLMLSVGQTRKANQWEGRLYLIDIASETIRLWMDDAAEADWVRPGFVYAVNPRGKRLATWAEMKQPVGRIKLVGNP